MTTPEAFLAAIREAPDDDAPRLIFADWLEDNGDPDRAEFIRLMIRLSPRLDDEALYRRAGALLVDNWRAWVGPLAREVGPSSYEPWLSGMPSATTVAHFPRGFVAQLTLEAPAFLRGAEALMRLVPLTGISFRRAGGLGAELARREELQWIRRLLFIDYYASPLDAADARALAASPHLGRVQVLSLHRNNLGDAGLIALVAAPWLAGVRSLDLTENGLSAAAARALAACRHLGGLRHLALSLNAIGDDGAQALAGAAWLPGLRSLSLDRTGVTSGGVALLRGRAPTLRVFNDVIVP